MEKKTMRKFGKGVWLHGLPEEGPKAIKDIVARLSRAGFDLFIPCVKNPDGYLDYQSRVGNIRPTFKDWDPLEVLSEEANKKGLKVHPWLCVFREGQGSKLLEKNKSLLFKAQSGKDDGWVCAMRKEVHDYEYSLYEEIVNKYDVAGVHLDYTRTEMFCYCDYCRGKFKELTNLDLLQELNADRSGLRRKSLGKWVEWREDRITDFVERISCLTKQKNLELSAAVGADYPWSGLINAQDWGSWVEKGLVDYIFPMTYSTGLRFVVDSARIHAALVNKKCSLWEGLVRFEGGGKMLIEQIKGVLKEGAEGIVIFSYPALKDGDIEAIKKLTAEEV